MRPDQHKKKRSSDYKKKHGVDNNKSHRTESYPQLHTVAESSDDESRKFGKAQIKSNWERYKEIADVEEDRGEDYSILVSRGGDASSHKKLAGEDDWDAEATLEDFDIDYQRLASQLHKLPPVQRFSLDKLGLSPDILTCFEENSNQETLSNPVKSEVAAVPGTLISKVESSDLGFNFSIKPGHVVSSDTKFHVGMEHDIDEKHEGDSNNVCEDEEEEIQDDHLLDELLESTNVTGMSHNSTKQQDGEEFNAVSPIKDQPQDESDTTTEVEDLEDWLDSIL